MYICMHGARGGEKRALESLELEILMIENHIVSTGNQIQVLWMSRASSLAPILSF